MGLSASEAAKLQPDKKRSGLSVGSTVGIAIGVALFLILAAFGAWVFYRRRRKIARQLKAQENPPLKGDVETPNQEFASDGKPVEMMAAESTKKLETRAHLAGSAVEADGQEKKMAELGNGVDQQGYLHGAKYVSEMNAGNNAHELPARGQDPVEIGESTAFVAEMEDTSAPPKNGKRV